MNAPGSIQRTVVKAACPHDCPDTCAMEVTVENGVAVSVRGGDMPFTDRVLCTKVAKYLERTRNVTSTSRCSPGRTARSRWG